MNTAAIDKASHELVDRARLGDQNAIAMLVKVRENAAKGVARAKHAYEAAVAYAKGKAPEKSRVGADPLKQLKTNASKVKTPQEYLSLVSAFAPTCNGACAAEIFSRGPAIGSDVLTFVGSTFGADDQKRAFEYGVMGPPGGIRRALAGAKPKYQRALRTGHVLGLAKRLQAARTGNIAAISRKAAWELT